MGTFGKIDNHELFIKRVISLEKKCNYAKSFLFNSYTKKALIIVLTALCLTLIDRLLIYVNSESIFYNIIEKIAGAFK